MVLKDLFHKNEQSQQEYSQDERKYRLGAQRIFRVDPSTLDLVVTGKLDGTLKVGDLMNVTNMGEEHTETKTVAVYAIETAERERVFEATDTHVILWLEDALPLGIKKGTVLHHESVETEQIFQTYATTLGEVFIGEQEGVLQPGDLPVISLADLTEIWRIYAWYCNLRANEETEVERQVHMDRLEQLVVATRDKLLQSPLSVVYSTVTGEPYLFSQTMQKEDGSYFCSAPMIFVAPTPFEERLKSRFSNEKEYVIKRIEKDDVISFLTDVFYLNGATGIHLMNEQTSIAAQGIIAAPNYDGLADEDIPVTNPAIMRWLLLLGQMGEPKSDEAHLIYQLYFRFMALEMPKARFLTPIKGVETGHPAQLSLGTDANFKLAILEGKSDKEAVVFYTDWKRLREVYDDEWTGLIQSLQQVTTAFDVAINPTAHPAIGCYVTEELYQQMTQMV